MYHEVQISNNCQLFGVFKSDEPEKLDHSDRDVDCFPPKSL